VPAFAEQKAVKLRCEGWFYFVFTSFFWVVCCCVVPIVFPHWVGIAVTVKSSILAVSGTLAVVTEVLFGFPQSLLACRECTSNMPPPLSSKSFPFNHSCMFIPFSAVSCSYLQAVK
jgi:hypothetical protein